MGTRGFITFVVDGTEKTAYNHWDSYPDGLGADVLKWLRTESDRGAFIEGSDWLATLARQIRALRVVDPDSQATDEDIERLGAFANRSVGSRDARDWYVLLRETQGKPELMLAAGVIEDASGFPADSLYAEWGYVVDLDAARFEVYRGFQTSPHASGRFASRPQVEYNSVGPYYPAALLVSWPLTELPSDEDFASATSGDEDDED